MVVRHSIHRKGEVSELRRVRILAERLPMPQRTSRL